MNPDTREHLDAINRAIAKWKEAKNEMECDYLHSYYRAVGMSFEEYYRIRTHMREGEYD